MAKNLLKKIVNDEDWHAAGFNFAAAYLVGKTATAISEKFFNFPLNYYNSVDHFAIGVGLGTIAYRKAGGGLKGVLAGLAAGTAFNLGWEILEAKGDIYGNEWSLVDTISDISIVYAGNALGFLAEIGKKHIKKEKKKISMNELIESSRERYESKLDRFYNTLCKKKD